MKLSGKKIVLGVTGSIAAYKAVLLLRLFKKEGADVRVVTTPAVDNFVGELSFSALSGHEVFGDLWNENWSEHVSLGNWADIMVIAPATANTLGKMAHGLCDNALLAVNLAARCPVMVAPAMDADMFIHPRTLANLEILKQDGVIVLPTGSGYLASGLEGPGRLLEPEAILERVVDQLQEKPLLGRKILVSAGPTREAIDPVRFISNRSTGKMGYALAEVARDMGGEVILVSGPTKLNSLSGLEQIAVTSAGEMFEVIKERAPEQDVIIMAAAVADYTPRTVAEQKIKKKDGDMAIPLKRTTDILRYLGEHKPKKQQLVGFAMETENELDNAKKKLVAKNLDFVVLNSLNEAGAGFGHDTNRVTILQRNGDTEALPLMSKKDVAREILSKLAFKDPD
jgi:phosphopantothenoylcysteine decarboxylase/phosphopantothenate--cysteine ligase